MRSHVLSMQLTIIYTDKPPVLALHNLYRNHFRDATHSYPATLIYHLRFLLLQQPTNNMCDVRVLAQMAKILPSRLSIESFSYRRPPSIWNRIYDLTSIQRSERKNYKLPKSRCCVCYCPNLHCFISINKNT